eukprot:4300266-Ditylum_brightwellii.AAC.1
MYEYFFAKYDDADLAQDLRYRRSASFILIITNQVATHWEISKQHKLTGVASSSELCIAYKGIVKAVDIRNFSASIGYPMCESTMASWCNNP